MNITRIINNYTLLALGTTLAGAAYAQPAANAHASEVLDEVIVTAQKREQNLQDVPIAVTAVSSQALRDAGVFDIKDLTVLTPGLIVRSSGDESLTNARIRGVGTAGEDDGLESSVGMVIDGVYRPRLGVGIGDLGEIERIEVLKGPQGTLFGRNNTAGVINVVTQAPSFDFGARGEMTAGNYGALGASGSITGTLVDDTLAGRLFVARRARDGYSTIRTGGGPRTSREDMTQDYHSVRGQLLFTPADTVTAHFSADYTKRDEECCVLINITDNQTLAAFTGAGLFPDADGGVLNPAQPKDRVGYANRDAKQNMEDGGVSLHVDWETPWFGRADLTSITGWRDWSNEAVSDYYDWTSVDLTYGNIERSFEQFSQELRLAGRTDAVDWLVGGYFSNEVIHRRENINLGADYDAFINTLISAQTGGFFDAADLTGGARFAGVGNSDSFRQEDNTWALFTHDTFHLTQKLDLTMGLRYTSGERELRSSYVAGAAANACGGAISEYDSGANPGWTTLAALAPDAPPELLSLFCVSFWDPRFGALGATTQSRTEEEWSGTVNLAYHFTPDFMTYATYSRGYKGGGFNFQRVRTAPTGIATAAQVLGVPNADTSVAAEFTDSYEIGARTQWLDGALTVNATAFHEVFTDFQRNDFRGTAWFTFAVPEVVTEGIDFDFSWRTPLDGLSLRGGATWNDAKTSATSNPPPFLDPAIFGRQLSQTPRYTAALGGVYEMPVGAALVLRSNVDVLWTDSYPWRVNGLQPDTIAEETRVNARVALAADSGRWVIELWGQNLLDEAHAQAIVAFPLTDPIGGAVLGVLSPPRTYGLTVRVFY
jgi:iron complex outermembrane recepter protein